MNKLICKNLLVFSFIITGLFLLAHTGFAQDVEPVDPFFSSLKTTAASAELGSEDVNFSLMVGNILRGLFGLLGTVFLVLVIYGGFIWMTAAGNEERVGKAKKIITQATIGLLIMVLAFAFTDFILGNIISSTQPVVPT